MAKTIEKKAANKNGVQRMIFVVLSVLLEVFVFAILFTKLNQSYVWLSHLTRFLALLLVLLIYGQNKTSSMKMPWIILILIFPVLGFFLYFLVGLNGHTYSMRKRYKEVDDLLLPILPENKSDYERLKEQNANAAAIASYIQKNTYYPVYQNADVTYFSSALAGLEDQLQELKNAESFIFMEYHAIEDKESWKRIQDVLVERAQHGVEVRIFYDDMGSIGFINTDFVKKMQDLGLKCRVFNPFAFGLNLFLNNRDHRKITVIDGKIGYTGGYNLANEYFGVTEPYGKWKDTGIKIQGEAVKSLTISFLEMWNACKKKLSKDKDYSQYFPDVPYETKEANSFVIPYADSPMDDLQVGEDVYISMVNKANSYCYFMTPYLILTDEMKHALGLAAMRGVDVRIVTPGIPDKKIVYGVTRSFYHELTTKGVQIYEWTPGFCHAKMSLADDRMATCGTINLDYRSLYHHFENGCFFVESQAVLDMKKDFEHIFTKCRNVTEEYTSGRSALRSIGQLFLRLFAELL